MHKFHWFAGVVLAMAVSADAQAANAPTVFKSLNPALGQLPESITTDQAGNIYLSMGTTVGKITPSGTLSTFSNIPIPAGTFVTGLKFGPDGYLYAGSASFSADPAAAFVWRIGANGQATEYAELDPHGFPNDLAFDDDGNLFVTDPFLGHIWIVDEDGNPDVWLADPRFEANFAAPYLGISPFGVDGIAFDKKKENLYVGNLDYGRILKIEIDCHNEPGDVDVFYENINTIGGADGLAFDDTGELYVAVHGQDKIVKIDKKGKKAETLASGSPLQQPSSLVFGVTKDAKKTLYISNFSILASLGVKPGPAKPALLKLKVQHDGQELP